ncbi:MAG TPA: hypothetical protein VHF50_07670 [Solirubrobacterales bacterium]|nr:hypothetical protein [Solirubrobacterales bacterium]
MSDETTIACTLGAATLEERLATVKTLGAESLLSHEREGNRHLLRFHDTAGTRLRLEEIVAAEAECCSFLDLDLKQDSNGLLLSIAAPAGAAMAVADGLAASFRSDQGRGRKRSRWGAALVGGGFGLAVCCVAVPVALGVAVTATLSRVLDLAAAILVGLGVGIVLRQRRRITGGRKMACPNG